MTVILNSAFATAEDTAKALGVSAARLKKLIRLAGPKAANTSFAMKYSSRSGANGRIKKANTTARRRKQSRGKTKKAAH